MQKLDSPSSVAWLLEHGGAVVRWRTMAEIAPETPAPELERLAAALLAHPPVQAWLARLNPGTFPAALDALSPATLRQFGNLVHSSQPEALENVLGKLAEYGLRQEMPGVEERLQPLLKIFHWKPAWRSDVVFQNVWETLVKSVCAWGLLRLGCTPDTSLSDFILEHLERCFWIARDQVYDLYASGNELDGLPKAWAGKPVMKQEVMAHYWLPYIHDLYLFAHLPPDFLDASGEQKLEALLAYILDPRFQALPNGYGYAWIKERRTCYGWGWSPHLPGFAGLDWEAPETPATLVLRLELMAHFPAACRSAWFQSARQHLEQFRTPSGTLLFPANCLREKSSGYYVEGAFMGLEGRRRHSTNLEIESTFRLAWIDRLSARHGMV